MCKYVLWQFSMGKFPLLFIFIPETFHRLCLFNSLRKKHSYSFTKHYFIYLITSKVQPYVQQPFFPFNCLNNFISPFKSKRKINSSYSSKKFFYQFLQMNLELICLFSSIKLNSNSKVNSQKELSEKTSPTEQQQQQFHQNAY